MSRFISTEECHASSYLHQSTSPPSTLRPIIQGYSILDAVVCVVCSENIVSKQSHTTSLGYVTPGLFSPQLPQYLSSPHLTPSPQHITDGTLCSVGHIPLSLHSNLHPSCHTLPLWQLQLAFLLNPSSPPCNNAQKHTNDDTFLSLGNLNPPDTQTLRSLPKSTYMGASVGSPLFQLTTLQAPSLRTAR